MRPIIGAIDSHRSITTTTTAGGSTTTTTTTVAGSMPPQEGFGALANGHLVGVFTTYTVTSLGGGFGAGTFGGGIASNRRIVFAVSGTITGRFDMSNIVNFTIDGTTAPYPGITFTGNGGEAAISIANGCSNIVVIGLTLANSNSAGNGGNTDGLNVQQNATNVMIKHCFAYGNTDGNIDFAEDCTNCTMQYCVIGNHVGNLSGDTGGTLVTGRKISVHHNFFYPKSPNPDEGERFPFAHFNYGTQVAGEAKLDARSNLIWMFGRGSSHTGSGFGVCVSYAANGNAVNNYAYTPGSDTTNCITRSAYGEPDGNLYASGNLSGNGVNANADNNHAEFTIPTAYQVANDPPCSSSAVVRLYAGPTQRHPTTGLREPYLQSHFDDLPATLPGC